MPIPQNTSINPDADRRLGRIGIFYGVLVFALLVLTTFGLSWANARYHPQTLKALLTPQLIVLNLLSILVVLIPFYAGIHRLYAARLEIGRERVAARAWGEAVAALEPFTAPMQRFLDGTGEAHYLLAQAYMGLGSKTQAETARAFVRRKKSVWAEKMSPGKGPARKGAAVYTASAQENRPRPAKGKPKRRF
jgi:fumarate reductase subunit D